jgi:class 3 adenylate cyclase
MAMSYNNIGLVYSKQGNYAESLKNHFASLDIKKKEGDKSDIASSYNNIGLTYWEMKNYPEALKNYFEALKLFREINSVSGLAMTYNNLGITYNRMEKYDDALKNHFASLKMKQEIGDKMGEASSYTNIGLVYNRKQNSKDAIEYLSKGLILSGEVGYKEGIRASYEGLSDAYKEMGDYKNAYANFKLASGIKDSIFNEESSKQIAEMQTKYETEKKEQQITLLNKDKELQDAQLNRQQIIIWSVAGGFLIVLVLSLFIYKERRKSEKLLLNILPAETAKELKAHGKAKAKYYESVTVMFTDFKGFTTIAEKLSAEELVSELDFIFKKFDELISRYNIEKIKTIGDAYMCASGLPALNSNHALEIIQAGLEIQNWMTNQNGKWQLRIGIHSGPVTAGVVGDKKFAYDIWGDTVNTASRMESSGEPGRVNVSGATYELIKTFPGFQALEKLNFIHRGKIPAKNKGEIDMYFVEKI